MLKKRFSDVRKAVLTTGEFLGTCCWFPKELPDDWLKEFRSGQLVIKIADSHLGIRPYSGDEIRVALESKIKSSEKEKWLSRMEKLRLKHFSFSISGIVMRSDVAFDLTKLSVKKIESNEVAQEDGKGFWSCPRCNAQITENPRDIDGCPICSKTYSTVECPNCKEDVWVDEPKCQKCGKDFKISKCPDCQKAFIVVDELEECPFCEQYIYLCPRCQEYIDEDPEDDDTDFCPICKKSLVITDCPKCRNDIFYDSEKCEHCGREFQLSKCPYSDCGKPIIILEGMQECPYCQYEIKYVNCPHCQKEFYIEI